MDRTQSTKRSPNSQRLIIVSNRLPVRLQEQPSGKRSIQPAPGGLVTALAPVLQQRGGLWIGWLGVATPPNRTSPDAGLKRLLAGAEQQTGYQLESVGLSPDEVENYYYGFSNAVLWPLFHDLLSKCRFEPRYWHAYDRVNMKFAWVAAQRTAEDDFIWVQDYHLCLLAKKLRENGAQRRTGFFLHTPFPPLDIFLRLPWRLPILEALLEYDLIGFQTTRDRRNFIQCVRALVPSAHVTGGRPLATVALPHRELRVGAFPISIDFRDFAGLAASKAVSEQAWIVHENLPNRTLILGVDRLDYTKGIPQRLLAFDNALTRYPDMRRRVTFIQVVVPSRREVEEYEELKHEIEQLVGQINGVHTEVGWMPIQYIFRSLDRAELVAFYRTCEIALITPLKDGMNLVSKEYCASSIEEDAVLILSEFTGAAAQLGEGAILVNPYDIEGVADAIYAAFTMERDSRRARMRRLRQSIRRNDVFRWVDSYLEAAAVGNPQ